MIQSLNHSLLVTGASGFLGGNLARYWLAYGNVIAQGNRHIPQIDGCTCIQEDLTHEKSVRNLIYNHKPTYVVHCAAMTSPDQCGKNPQMARKVNIDATQYLVNYANECEIPVIFLSTDLVFDGCSTQLYSEENTPNPVNLYGETKLTSEEIVLGGMSENTVFRIALSYGRYMPGATGGYLDILLNGLDSKVTQRLYTDQYRTPLFSGDFCQAVTNLIKAISTNSTAKSSRLYHICGIDRMSRYELAKLAAELHEKNLHYIEESSMLRNPAAQPRGADCALSCERAQKELNYQPHSVRDNLLYDKQIRKENA